MFTLTIEPQPKPSLQPTQNEIFQHKYQNHPPKHTINPRTIDSNTKTKPRFFFPTTPFSAWHYGRALKYELRSWWQQAIHHRKSGQDEICVSLENRKDNRISRDGNRAEDKKPRLSRIYGELIPTPIRLRSDPVAVNYESRALPNREHVECVCSFW